MDSDREFYSNRPHHKPYNDESEVHFKKDPVLNMARN